MSSFHRASGVGLLGSAFMLAAFSRLSSLHPATAPGGAGTAALLISEDSAAKDEVPRRLRGRLFARRRDDPKEPQNPNPTQGHDSSSNLGETVVLRLRGDPSMPLVTITGNVARYGYDPIAMTACPFFYQTLVHPDDAHRVMDLLAQMAMKWTKAGTTEFRIRSKDGTYTRVACRYRPLRDGAGRLLETELLLSRIDEEKTASDPIGPIPAIDLLTGLVNRSTFKERIGQALAETRRGAPSFAILYLDLDWFENVTETLGCSAGDSLLKSVADRLALCTRETDLVAHLGGDKFAILQTNLTDVSNAEGLASRIRDVLSAPHLIGDAEMHVTVSIGISAGMFQTGGPGDILTQAELALFRAKEQGRNKYCFHTGELDREAQDRVALVADLGRALERGELELFFQQQVELATGLIVGMEPLIRWNHPARGPLRAPEFLPIVEDAPVMSALGQWVLDHACEQMSAWREAGICPPKLTMNLSLKQLQAGERLVASITQTLSKWRLSPRDLELDVTESMLAHVILHGNDVPNQLQRLGVEIAIDDFGMLYSSLDYLEAYRVNRVKIPRAMVDAGATDPEASAMIWAIMDLGQKLGIDVVAQRIETREQLGLLSGATPSARAQGFFFSAPVPAVEATQLLLRQGLVELDRELVPSVRTGFREGYYGEGYYR